MAFSRRNRSLASSSSSGPVAGAIADQQVEAAAAAQLALEAGISTIRDIERELDSFDDSGLMSEPGDDEAQARQRELDKASEGFLLAVPTGIVDADGLCHYSDDTWRPAGIVYGPTTEVYDMSTPPPEETGPVLTEVSSAKRTRAAQIT